MKFVSKRRRKVARAKSREKYNNQKYSVLVSSIKPHSMNNMTQVRPFDKYRNVVRSHSCSPRGQLMNFIIITWVSESWLWTSRYTRAPVDILSNAPVSPKSQWKWRRWPWAMMVLSRSSDWTYCRITNSSPPRDFKKIPTNLQKPLKSRNNYCRCQRKSAVTRDWRIICNTTEILKYKHSLYTVL